MPKCWLCYRDADEKEYHAGCSQKFFGTKEVPLLTLTDTILKKLATKTISQHIAVTGVHPKLSVTLQKTKEQSRLTVVGVRGEYILKPQQGMYPGLPETEDLTMHIASEFKINVCRHTLLEATDGHIVYIAKRFDRNEKQKIHVEDFCQLSGFLTENKYKGSYEKARKLISTYCINSGLDTLNYF
jgi:serine/threonine-protein kinase HipA